MRLPLGGITPQPRYLKQLLDTYVVGQSRPKRILSVAVYNHWQRINDLRKRQRQEEEYINNQAQVHPTEDEYPGQQRTVQFWRERQSFSVEDTGPQQPEVELEKSNVLMIGPTGVGKTLIARTLAKILDIPFSISDCTAFTQAGYVGDDVEVCIHRLLAASNWDLKRAETGIICLDEVDKIASSKSSSHGRDVSGEGVQQALLKLLEGTVVQVSAKSRPSPGLMPNQGPYNTGPNTTSHHLGSRSGPGISTGVGGSVKGETFLVDTSNILFILCGAFSNLQNIILDRLSQKSIGFTAPVRSSTLGSQTTAINPRLINGDESYRMAGSIRTPRTAGPEGPMSQRRDEFGKTMASNNILEYVEQKDLVDFGLIPEFVGRAPVMAAFESLDEEALIKVLKEPRNSILKQYEYLFALSGIELRVTNFALRQVAKTASKMQTGARGLRTSLEQILVDAMFEAPGSSVKHVLISQSVAQGKDHPLYFTAAQEHRFIALYDSEEAEWAAEQGTGKEAAAADQTTMYEDNKEVESASAYN